MSTKKPWAKKEEQFLIDNHLKLTTSQMGEKLDRRRGSVDCKMRRMRLKTPENVRWKALREGAMKGNESKRGKKRKKEFDKGMSIHSITYLGIVKMMRKSIRVKKTTMEKVLNEICEIFSKSEEELKGNSREHLVVVYRHIFCFVCKKSVPGLPLQKIAEFLGYAGHDSALHGINTVKKRIEVEDEDFMKTWRYYLQNTKIFMK